MSSAQSPRHHSAEPGDPRLGAAASHAWRAVSLVALALAALSLLLNAQALPRGAEEPAAEPEATVEEVVRELLMEHPDIIVAALSRFVEEQEAAARRQEHDLVAAHADQLLADPVAPEIGNPSGDVTIVEFVDYQCGFCKRTHPILKELIAQDGNIRLVFKEIPILGPASVVAARAILSARDLDRFEDFHDALMEARVRLDEDRVFAIAASVGIDVEALREKMEGDGAVHRHALAQNFQLAQALGIRGTPGFVVGGRVIRGTVDLAMLRELIHEARNGHTTLGRAGHTDTDP